MVTIRDLYTKYRAAGVYTVYNDKTIAPAINTSAITRFVVGVSKVGPFNVPVFINRGDFEAATAIFGNIDKALERQGSFFHRSIQTCLEDGPVIALNLLSLNNEIEPDTPPIGYVAPTYPADLVPYTPFSISADEKNGDTTDRLYASYFNKERFWRADERYLLATRLPIHNGFLFNLVNLSKNPVTYLIRKSQLPGFDITVQEWYGSSEIPAYVRKSDFISDYFLDVIVIAGDFGASRYEQLATDAVFGEFFDVTGLKSDKIDEFLSLREVSVNQIFTGSIIPGFKDKRNTPYYLGDVINNGITQHGILCAIDQKQLDEFEFGTNLKGLDMVGHSLAAGGVNELDFLSYKARIAQDFSYDQSTVNPTIIVDTTSDTVITPAVGKITVSIGQTNPEFANLVSNMELGDYILGETTAEGTTAGVPVANPVLKVTKIQKTATTVVFDLTSGFKDNENASSGSLLDIALVANNMTVEYNPSRFYRDGTSTYYVADVNSQIYKDWLAGDITSGDKIVIAADEFWLTTTKVKAKGGVDTSNDYRPILQIQLFDDAELTTAIVAGTAPDFGDSYDSAGYPITTATKLNIISGISDMNVRVDITDVDGESVVFVAIADTSIAHDDFLVGLDSDGDTILTRIKTIQNVDTTGDGVYDSKKITCYDKIKITTSGVGANQIERFKSFDGYVTTYNLIHQPGFALQQHHLPNGTNSRMRSILEVMTKSIMRDAIIDPDMINFRYYVDTFNHGLEANSKGYISDMLQERQTCLGIMNAPAVQEFIDSTNPRFTTAPTAADPLPIFNVEFVKEGGNLAENPEFLYTMPTESQGASWASYFFPNVVIIDDDQRVAVPPAALVSNAFMRKFATGEPFKVVANRRGILQSNTASLVGTEYALTAKDRGFLEAKGVNPIIQKNDGSIMVFGNQSGFQSFRSVLNNLHVRDMLITIQVDVQNTLADYVFEFNNDALRLEVSSLLRNYLQKLQNSYGAISFFDVIFDRTNNTPEIVRENVGIIDLIVEPTDVATRYINRITLTKSGQPAVGGFTAI